MLCDAEQVERQVVRVSSPIQPRAWSASQIDFMALFAKLQTVLLPKEIVVAIRWIQRTVMKRFVK